ncbi:hypothetical protein FACS1894201_08270 [Bacteroidia bacterium]|nr:hypothetical protein FACS1894201_08270 [Bacteroidia bacterium]
MSLFQHTVLKKQIAASSNKIGDAYKLYASYFLNPEVQENIRDSKEEQFQEGFLRELFVKIFGYTLNPEPNYNLITEKKNETNSKKADGAILINSEVRGVIELKDHKTTDLKQVESQAFGYKNNNRKTAYVIISNFEKLRFYIENTIDFEEFNLFHLKEEDFAVLWICLAYENIAKDLPKQLKSESTNNEDQITKQLYKDYSTFKRELYADILAHNKGINPLALFKKTQKLLDRLLFIFFAEDCNLLPPNSMSEIITQWENLKDMDEYKPLYERIKKYFGYMNMGFKGKKYDVFAYNGGLFKPDEILDSIVISDDVLRKHSLKLCQYDFASEVDVNILGHIFENSLSEIEEIATDIARGLNPLSNTNAVSKRKKDGVFYTPRYITTYIVENTLGKLCADKKKELAIDESEYFAAKKRPKAETKKLADKLTVYRDWLLALTICDPACGSGAFLNAALDFLMSEHRLLDELTAKLFGSAIVFPDIENTILENNLYGVDINEESVEIAKLALWLRTAKPQRKLNSLNNNIKCGNSLISPCPSSQGDLSPCQIEKAFDWQKEFPQVFKEKDKIAFHVTTAIHDSRTSQRMIDYKVREKRYNKGINPLVSSPIPLYDEDELIITKTIAEIVKDDNLNVLAYNICRDHLHILLVCEAEELDKFVGKIKGRTARACNSNKGIHPLVKEGEERSVPLWTQKFGYKEITNHEQLYNTIEYIKNNRIKHELPDNKGIHPLANTMLCTIDHAFRPEYTGGFDVVIGNPPYVQGQINDSDKKYYTKYYKTVEGKPDLYRIFIEKSIDLIKDNGIMSFITPNTFLTIPSSKKLRDFIKENCSICKVFNFKGSVFEEANVNTAIFVIEKGGAIDKTQFIFDNAVIPNAVTLLKAINESNWVDYDNLKKSDKIECLQNEQYNTIINKINEVKKTLSELADYTIGLQVYHNTIHSKDDITNRIYHSETKKDETYIPEIGGKNIARYNLLLPIKEYVSYGEWCYNKPDIKYLTGKRILVREIPSKENLICSLYEGNGVPNKAVIIIKSVDSILYELLAILNSKLMGFYINNTTEKGTQQLFPRISLTSIKNIPIKLSESNVLSDKVQQMLSLNADLQAKRQRFLKRLSDNFNLDITRGLNPLSKFDELEFKQFLAELKKQKITLSLKQQDEWEEYFNEYQSECRNFVGQIEATDKEIDGLVYALYGLGEKEIKIIEN